MTYHISLIVDGLILPKSKFVEMDPMDRMVNLFKKTQKLVFTSQREYTFVYFLTNGPYTFTINGNMGDFFKGLRERIAEIGFSETCFSPDPDVSSTGLVHRIFTMHT